MENEGRRVGSWLPGSGEYWADKGRGPRGERKSLLLCDQEDQKRGKRRETVSLLPSTFHPFSLTIRLPLALHHSLPLSMSRPSLGHMQKLCVRCARATLYCKMFAASCACYIYILMDARECTPVHEADLMVPVSTETVFTHVYSDYSRDIQGVQLANSASASRDATCRK